MIRDSYCLLSILLFIISNIILILSVTEEASLTRKAFNDPAQWYALNPDYLQELWIERGNARFYQNNMAIFNALAWFSLVMPVCETAYHLSEGGKRMFGLHISIAALALGGSMSELLGHLMTIGFNNAVKWVVSRFNLDNWGVSETGVDGMGWRVVEVLQVMGNGIVLWVDAFEWVALALITLFIALSIRSDAKEGSVFTPYFSGLSVVVALASFFNFACTVFKLSEYLIWYPLSIALTVLNTFVLLPLWLYHLSGVLPAAKANREVAQTEENGEEVEITNIT